MLQNQQKVTQKKQVQNFKLGSTTKEVRNNGENVVVVTEEHGELEFEAVLHATGRRANTENLGLENTDIELRPNGSIVVDEYVKQLLRMYLSVGDVNWWIINLHTYHQMYFRVV